MWALIFGGSSGIGLATAQLLASKGYSLCIVHRDRKVMMDSIEKDFEKIREGESALVSLNISISNPEAEEKILDLLKSNIEKGSLKLFLHSIADGNVKPLTGDGDTLKMQDFEHTVNTMGLSYLNWSRKLHEYGFYADSAVAIALTSEGAHHVLPGYAAVGIAKSVLENSMRYLAVELAAYGVRANVVNSGICDTKALRKIPNSEKFIASARKRNPFKRLTQASDVANVIYLLSRDEASWITGNIINADGGEQINIVFDE